MSNFQNKVNPDQPFGVPGDIVLGMQQDSRAEPVTITEDAKGPVFGKAVTYVGDSSLGFDRVPGSSIQGKVGGSGQFIGVLANPRATAAYAPAAHASGVLKGQTVEVVTDTPGIAVVITSPVKVGSTVSFDAEGNFGSTGTAVPGSVVVRFDADKGIAFVALTQLAAAKGGSGGESA